HKNADCRTNLFLSLEDIDLLQFIVVVNTEVISMEVRNEIAGGIFNGDEYIDEIDIDFEGVLLSLAESQKTERAEGNDGGNIPHVSIIPLRGVPDIDGKCRDWWEEFLCLWQGRVGHRGGDRNSCRGLPALHKYRGPGRMHTSSGIHTVG